MPSRFISVASRAGLIITLAGSHLPSALDCAWISASPSAATAASCAPATT